MDEAVQECLRLGAEERGLVLDRGKVREFTVYCDLRVQRN